MGKLPKLNKATLYVVCLLLGLSLVAISSGGDVVQSAATAAFSGGGLRAYGGHLQPLVSETDRGRVLNIYAPDGLIATRVTGDGDREGLYVLADHLGSSRVTPGTTGHSEYAPYGTLLAATTGRYAGHPYDPQQELYLTPGRGYDPTISGFVAPDPRRQGASPYPYAGDNPIGYFDPTGDVTVPYFMKSGFQNKGRYISRSVARLFNIHEKQDIRDTSVFKKSAKSGYSTARRSLMRTFHGPDRKPGSRKFEFNDRFFWIMGNNEKVPNDLVRTFSNARGYQSTFARKLVLLNFADAKTGRRAQEKLERRQQSSLLITSEIEQGRRTSNAGPYAKGYVVDGNRLTPDQFRDYVEDKIFEKWPTLDISISRPDVPGHPWTDPAMTVSIPLSSLPDPEGPSSDESSSSGGTPGSENHQFPTSPASYHSDEYGLGSPTTPVPDDGSLLPLGRTPPDERQFALDFFGDLVQ